MTQKDSALKIGVVGAGAIGGICAGWIKNAGYDVRVVVRTPEHARQIMEEGIRITGIKGDLTIKMDAVSRVADMDGDRDIVLLCVKATSMMEAAEKLKTGLKPGAVVVSLQNGFCEEALAGVLGRETVIGCVTGWGATLHSPCRLEMTSSGDFIVGNIDNRTDSRLEEVRAVLDCVLPAKISTNIAGDLYSKLIINSCITSVGAVCGLYLGQMLSRQKARLIFLRIMEEAMAVAGAMGIEVAVFGGKLDYYRFLEKKGIFADLKRHLFLSALGFKYRRLKSSSLQSLERGKKTEIDYLTGFITSNALRFNISTPVNTQVLEMVKKIEQGKAGIASENLIRSFFDRRFR